jgi:hypothetical protein
VRVPIITATLLGAQLRVTGTGWLERVAVAISKSPDGSNPLALGTARVGPRGGFSFRIRLTGKPANPFYAVVTEKRQRVVVKVNWIDVSPPPALPVETPTPTPIP